MNTQYPLLLASLLCATGCQVYGLLCGRDCSNVCLNGSCLKYLHECKFGCKGGNQTACAIDNKGLKTDEDSTNTGLIVGTVMGALVAVAIIVALVIVIVILKRKQNVKKTTTSTEQTYTNAVADVEKDDDTYSALD